MATQVLCFPVLLKWYYSNGIILIKDSSLRKEGLLMTESFPFPARLQGDSTSLLLHTPFVARDFTEEVQSTASALGGNA